MHASIRKQRLREEMSSRPPVPLSTRQRVTENVSRWLDEHRPRVVVAFLAMGDEIDVSPLVVGHTEIRFALTRTAPGMTLTVHDWDAPRERHRFGFDQPAAGSATIPPAEVDVVLVPGLAFAPDGRRLGRGAGYYDRFLAGIAAETIALTTEDRIRVDLPRESHDVLVDWIATERDVVPAASNGPDGPSL